MLNQNLIHAQYFEQIWSLDFVVTIRVDGELKQKKMEGKKRERERERRENKKLLTGHLHNQRKSHKQPT